MRLTLALLGSLALHAYAISYLGFAHIEQDIMPAKTLPSYSVQPRSQLTVRLQEPVLKSSDTVSKPILAIKSEQKSALARALPAVANASANTGEEKIEADPLSNFLSSTQIQRRALPISNIDISMVQGVFISGLPIKLRLYINASGKVIKIKTLDYAAADTALKNKLTELLYQLTFLPAKKDGADVDSYQDVAFNFQANLTAMSD